MLRFYGHKTWKAIYRKDIKFCAVNACKCLITVVRKKYVQLSADNPKPCLLCVLDFYMPLTLAESSN